MNVQELTAQTGRDLSQRRQAYFQEVFLSEEPPAPCGIDVLSVTTTMEAGVDIGSLRAVLLANMPPAAPELPAARRASWPPGHPFRSRLDRLPRPQPRRRHFAHPSEMTAATPGEPYLTTDRDAIFRRVYGAEALRLAFDAWPTTIRSLARADNIHGQFGVAAVVRITRGARQPVSRRLTRESSCVAAFLDTRCSPSGHRGRAHRPCVDRLVDEVRDIAALAGEHPDLSQRLAERGLLPLFGFPTLSATCS